MASQHDDQWPEVAEPGSVPASPKRKPGPANGAELLSNIERFLGRFVAYPSSHARVAHTLWAAHTWFMDRWDSTPRIAFLSTEPGSGKSRALEVTEPLVPRPVHAVNATPAYLFRKVADPGGPPTILYDEIDTVFGPKAKDNEDVRGMLNAGHRRGATAGRCVMKGKVVETEELEAYCAVALAGLDDLPDTIGTRSVIIRMRRRAADERIEPWRYRLNEPEATPLAEQLHRWSQETGPIDWPDLPDGVEDRNADVWEPLISLADLAGDEWPDRARAAALALVKAGGEKRSLGVQLLADLRAIFHGRDVMFTEDIIRALVALEESPWGDLRGKELDARGLSYRLRKYEVKPTTVRIGERVAKGYKAVDLADPWARYLPLSSDSAVTSVTPSQDPTVRNGVTDVTAESEGRGSARGHQPGTGSTGLTGSDGPASSATSASSAGSMGRAGVCPQPPDRPCRACNPTELDGPGRCVHCGHHLDTQGHLDGCPIGARADGTAA